MPVPERETDCGLLPAFVFTVKLPVRAPLAVGVNFTLMLQLELAARVAGLAGHVFVWLKSPLLAMELIARAQEALLLVKVAARELLVVPAFWFPKPRDAGVRLICGVQPDGV